MSRTVRPRLATRIEGNAAYIDLGRGYTATVDIGDLPSLEQHRWYALVNTKGRTTETRYATSLIAGHTIYMHRFLLGLGPENKCEVDHINFNGLDNRRSNLRIATRKQNAQHSRGSKKRGFKGVRYESKFDDKTPRRLNAPTWGKTTGGRKIRQQTPEMATFLRACVIQQLTLRECGARLGITHEGARQLFVLYGIPRYHISTMETCGTPTPWAAYITVGDKDHLLGRFATEKEAAAAYDNAALRHFGEFAAVNLIETASPQLDHRA